MHPHSSRDGLVQEGKRSAEQMEPRVVCMPILNCRYVNAVLAMLQKNLFKCKCSFRS